MKAVILHEFLHVLLRHTEDRRPLTPARHLAFDAVINAIIHRQFGRSASSMMSEYYAEASGLRKLLRPMNEAEEEQYWQQRKGSQLPDALFRTWAALYNGDLIADDIEALAEEFAQSTEMGGFESSELLGNHDELGQKLPPELEKALNAAMKEMNGAGIWRAPRERGVGANPYKALFTGIDTALDKWRRKALAVLRQHVEPDRHSRARCDAPQEYRIPVLSPGDRRAYIRALWTPFLPDAAWNGSVRAPRATTQVYLDVSGSMNAEMPLIITLLGQLSVHIRRPFWAFSDQVAPAVIEKGQLRTATSGGTSMSCVLEHLAKTRPASAVVVTDGYIEQVQPGLLKKAAATRLHAIVTRDGNPAALRKAGIAYTQLDRVPS